MKLYEQIDMLPIGFYSGEEIKDMLKSGYIYRSVWYRLITDKEIAEIDSQLEIEKTDKEYDSIINKIL